LKLFRVLRSRRLAIVLLVGLTVYSWVATWLAPEQAPAFMARLSSPFLSRIVTLLGFERPFSAPIFILAVALVTASTSACAWERSRLALKYFAPLEPTAESRELLSRAPRFTVLADRGSSHEAVIQRAAAALRRFRLRVRVNDDVVNASGGALGVIGSALFHWALVGVFVFAALGQLTRYEGYANVVQGSSTTDSPKGYDVELIRGPMFGEWFSGFTLGVAEIDLAHQVDEVAHGGAALVTLSKGDREIKRQWVYPNHPLRFGSLLVHRADVHPVFLGTLRTDGSSVVRKVELHFAPDPPTPRSFSLEDPQSGNTVDVTIFSGGIQLASVAITSGGATTTQTVGVGESVEIVKGQRLTIDALAYAAQLHVVSDWSVPWLYAMFIVGTLSVAAAVLVPTRRVSVLIVSDSAFSESDGPASSKLHVRFTRRRNDPAFPRLLEEALRAAVNDTPTAEREGSQ